MDSIREAVVSLVWTDKNNPKSTQSFTTGFIHKRNAEGLFILSTAHQFRNIFKNPTEVPKSQIGVKVEFFDRTTFMDADVLHLDMDKDLTLMIVKSCDQLKTHPIACIEPILFSMDPPHGNQDIYTFHHPVWYDIATCKRVHAYYQYTQGFIVGKSNANYGMLIYSMPLTFPGSFGAPVVNKNSNKLMSIIAGDSALHNVPQIGHAGTMQSLDAGPMVSVIERFLNEAETSNPPTTESGQSAESGFSC